MPPQTGTALLILVAFVLPGFATVLLKERMHEAWREVNQFERLLQTGYYSIWCFVLLALFADVISLDQPELEDLYRDHRDTPADLVWRVALAILVPAFIVANASRLWERWRFRRWLYAKVAVNVRHRIPTAWDCFFAQRSRAMVLATLKDGRVLGGYYGLNSFAAYAKDGKDLYLEQRWALNDDNWFEQPANDSKGLWIPTDEVVSIELYLVNDDHDESKEAVTPAAEGATEARSEHSPSADGPQKAAEQAPGLDA